MMADLQRERRISLNGDVMLNGEEFCNLLNSLPESWACDILGELEMQAPARAVLFATDVARHSDDYDRRRVFILTLLRHSNRDIILDLE